MFLYYEKTSSYFIHVSIRTYITVGKNMLRWQMAATIPRRALVFHLMMDCFLGPCHASATSIFSLVTLGNFAIWLLPLHFVTPVLAYILLLIPLEINATATPMMRAYGHAKTLSTAILRIPVGRYLASYKVAAMIVIGVASHSFNASSITAHHYGAHTYFEMKMPYHITTAAYRGLPIDYHTHIMSSDYLIKRTCNTHFNASPHTPLLPGNVGSVL